MDRSILEKTGYPQLFPHLLGEVSFEGRHAVGCPACSLSNATLNETRFVLTPAACYPVYPIVAARGVDGMNGFTVGVKSYCFRNEATTDHTRLKSFEMREIVFFGHHDKTVEFRQAMMTRVIRLFETLGIEASLRVASDPFFGRAGRVMAKHQEELNLKFEACVMNPFTGRDFACASFNLHLDHFTELFGISDEHGGRLMSSCVAFGLDRIMFALRAIHGADIAAWPARVWETIES